MTAAYETAGSLREGKQIWLLAKLPEKKIAGDAVEPYLCFTNAHDGSSVKVCMTPVRVVCNNKVRSISARIREATGLEVKPIYFCAGYKEDGEDQMPPYNLTKLLYYYNSFQLYSHYHQAIYNILYEIVAFI